MDNSFLPYNRRRRIFILLPCTMTEEKKILRKTQRTSRLSTVVSISLVLFLLGTLSLLLLHARKLSDHVRENIEIVLIIKPEADSTALEELVQLLQSKEQIKSCKRVSREEAAVILKKDLGEDFVQFLGYNPLYPSIDIRFKAEYSDEVSIGNFLAKYKRHPLVHQIDYQPSLVESINRNLRTITWILLTFSVLLIIVSVTLINNTIRISLYARRLLIKSMLLVGATKGFILKPFLIISIWNGILGALISIFLIGALSYFAAIKIPELAIIQDLELIFAVAGSLMLSGIFLSLTCTWFAVNRYLRYRTENLV